MSLRFKAETPDFIKLSVASYESKGYVVARVEHYVPREQRTYDLLGFIDALAWREGETVGLQPTSYSNMAARVKKIRASKWFPAVRLAGWRIIVHGWKQVNPIKWELHEREVT